MNKKLNDFLTENWNEFERSGNSIAGEMGKIKKMKFNWWQRLDHTESIFLLEKLEEQLARYGKIVDVICDIQNKNTRGEFDERKD